MAEAKHFAMSLAKEKEMTFINGYDHPQIIAGQGTTGVEIIDQIEDIDAIIVPIGGGSFVTQKMTKFSDLKKNVHFRWTHSRSSCCGQIVTQRHKNYRKCDAMSA